MTKQIVRDIIDRKIERNDTDTWTPILDTFDQDGDAWYSQGELSKIGNKIETTLSPKEVNLERITSTSSIQKKPRVSAIHIGSHKYIVDP